MHGFSQQQTTIDYLIGQFVNDEKFIQTIDTMHGFLYSDSILIVELDLSKYDSTVVVSSQGIPIETIEIQKKPWQNEYYPTITIAVTRRLFKKFEVHIELQNRNAGGQAKNVRYSIIGDYVIKEKRGILEVKKSNVWLSMRIADFI
mgnify:FL=1